MAPVHPVQTAEITQEILRREEDQAANGRSSPHPVLLVAATGVGRQVQEERLSVQKRRRRDVRDVEAAAEQSMSIKKNSLSLFETFYLQTIGAIKSAYVSRFVFFF